MKLFVAQSVQRLLNQIEVLKFVVVLTLAVILIQPNYLMAGDTFTYMSQGLRLAEGFSYPSPYINTQNRPLFIISLAAAFRLFGASQETAAALS